jgi:NAD(P)-dependent dehydrogenase (short-subunit alcohol dehydrogenase family)
MGRSVLITGSSTGIGAVTTARLAQAGWTVFAGVRREEDGAALVANVDGDVRPLMLDVSDESQIREAVAEVRAAVGAAGLDGLVNNAGIGLGGPVELIPMADWRRQFEVNLFGVIALTQEAFDLVRAARGRFVFIGSDGGRFSAPGTAPYSATKHAMEAVCESLRHELASTSMAVCLIEPGMVKTPIWDKTAQEIGRVDGLIPDDRRAEYGFLVPAMIGFTEEGRTKGTEPEKVAGRIEHALTATRPKARYLVGPDAKVLGGVVTRLPDPVRDRIFAAVTRRLVRQGERLSSAAPSPPSVPSVLRRS